MATAPHEVLTNFLRDQFAPTTTVIDYRKRSARELMAIFRNTASTTEKLLAAEALIAKQAIAMYGRESCGYTDEYNNDFDITYDVTAKAMPADDTDPGTPNEIAVRTVELSGWAIPLRAFSRSFIDCIEERCFEHANEGL